MVLSVTPTSHPRTAAMFKLLKLLHYKVQRRYWFPSCCIHNTCH